MTRGKFIAFEGGEGTGKTTQVRRLSHALAATGLTVITTREPGGSEGAEDIRELLVTGNKTRWTPMSEALLFLAARVDHVERVIKPHLEKGHWVISDRFISSSLAYQGDARGLGQRVIKCLHEIALPDFQPDLTIVLDIDPNIGLSRARKRGEATSRFEALELDFHKKIRASYQRQALMEAMHMIIDATISEEQVAELVFNTVWKNFL